MSEKTRLWILFARPAGLIAAAGVISIVFLEAAKEKAEELKPPAPAANPVAAQPSAPQKAVITDPVIFKVDAVCSSRRFSRTRDAQACAETLRQVILNESETIWRDVMGSEVLHGPDPHWNSHPLAFKNIDNEDWERLCLGLPAQSYGSRDEIDVYLRTPMWCLSTAQDSAIYHNRSYDTKRMDYLKRQVSSLSRLDL